MLFLANAPTAKVQTWEICPTDHGLSENHSVENSPWGGGGVIGGLKSTSLLPKIPICYLMEKLVARSYYPKKQCIISNSH